MKSEYPFVGHHDDGFWECEPYAQKAKLLNVPVIYKTRRLKPDPNPIIAICGECGREIHVLEEHWCLNTDCPIVKIGNQCE